VQQHLGRQVGVAKVDVSLVDGKVTIYPKEDSRFDPAAIFKAVYDSGVSVAEMTITATGELQSDPNEGRVFRTGNAETFEVEANDLSKKLTDLVGSGKAVRLRGLLYKKPGGKAKRKPPTSMPLEILEILN
jgi:hypothetical protein